MWAQPVGEVCSELGESPLWHGGALWWIDLVAPALHRLAGGAVESWKLPNPPPIGFIAATDHADCLLLGHRDGVSLLELGTLAQRALCNPERTRLDTSVNDGTVAPDGSLWFGTSDLAEIEPRGSLYRLALTGEASVVDTGFAVTNGPAFSPDGHAYVSDTVGRRILAYDLDAQSGRPVARRVFARMAMDEGMPDGLCVDADGALWCAHWDGWRLTRYAPSGERLLIVPLPVPRPTALAFGGTELRSLFVTTARDGLDPPTQRAAPWSGRLLKLEAAHAGLPGATFPLCGL